LAIVCNCSTSDPAWRRVSSHRLEHDLPSRFSLQTDTSDIAISPPRTNFSRRSNATMALAKVGWLNIRNCFVIGVVRPIVTLQCLNGTPRPCSRSTHSQTKLLFDRTRSQSPHPYRLEQHLTLRRRPAHARECSPKNNYSSHIHLNSDTTQDPPASVKARVTRQQLHHALFPQPRKSSPCKLVLQVDR